jgi:membrane protease YdiL (CAAX protease family)
LHRVRDDPTQPLLFAFASISCLFLLTALSWIVTFPYDYNSSPNPVKRYSKVQTMALAAGLVIAVVLIAGSYWSLFVRPGALFDERIHIAEVWLYKASFIVYSFLAIRFLFPLAAKDS